MIFFYKFFYVFFLYYTRFKNDVPWIGALSVIVICIFMLCLSLLSVIGLFNPLMDLLNKFNMHPKLSLLIFVCLVLYFIGRISYFVLFKKMKISKVDGKHPNYDFKPAKIDKFKVYSVSVIIFSSPFLIKGIQIFCEENLNK